MTDLLTPAQAVAALQERGVIVTRDAINKARTLGKLAPAATEQHGNRSFYRYARPDLYRYFKAQEEDVMQ